MAELPGETLEKEKAADAKPTKIAQTVQQGGASRSCMSALCASASSFGASRSKTFSEWQPASSSLHFTTSSDGAVLPVVRDFSYRMKERPMAKKLALVTGASSGIGYWLAKELASLTSSFVRGGRAPGERYGSPLLGWCGCQKRIGGSVDARWSRDIVART